MLFVHCTTREINAAAGLRPQKPIVGFRQSQSISLCLYLPFSDSLSLYLRVSSPETAEPPPFNLLQPCTSEVLPTPFYENWNFPVFARLSCQSWFIPAYRDACLTPALTAQDIAGLIRNPTFQNQEMKSHTSCVTWSEQWGVVVTGGSFSLWVLRPHRRLIVCVCTVPDGLLVLLIFFAVDDLYPTFPGPRTPWKTADKWQRYKAEAYRSSPHWKRFVKGGRFVNLWFRVGPSMWGIVAGDMSWTITSWCRAPGAVKKKKKAQNLKRKMKCRNNSSVTDCYDKCYFLKHSLFLTMSYDVKMTSVLYTVFEIYWITFFCFNNLNRARGWEGLGKKIVICRYFISLN